jgi:hypothetical protein
MAEVAEGEGETDEARDWRARAMQAPRDATWTCGACGTLHGTWSALCPRCGAFDTYEWRLPDDAGTWAPRRRIDKDLERAGDLTVALQEEGGGFFSQLAKFFGGSGAASQASPAEADELETDEPERGETVEAGDEDPGERLEALDAPESGGAPQVIDANAEPADAAPETPPLALPAADPAPAEAPKSEDDAAAAPAAPDAQPVPDAPAPEEGPSREDAARLVG